jgi:hypothetical protein
VNGDLGGPPLAEPVILVLDLALHQQRLLPPPLQLPRHEPVLRLDRVVLKSSGCAVNMALG